MWTAPCGGILPHQSSWDKSRACTGSVTWTIMTSWRPCKPPQGFTEPCCMLLLSGAWPVTWMTVAGPHDWTARTAGSTLCFLQRHRFTAARHLTRWKADCGLKITNEESERGGSEPEEPTHSRRPSGTATGRGKHGRQGTFHCKAYTFSLFNGRDARAFAYNSQSSSTARALSTGACATWRSTSGGMEADVVG